MGQISAKLRSLEGGVAFWCPGCKEMHCVATVQGQSPCWGYNGNPTAPTFTPSLLIRSGHFASGHKPGDSCWCNWEDRETYPDLQCRICHTFVTDGRIQFLGDCTHELAGQTVDIPDLPEGHRDAA